MTDHQQLLRRATTLCQAVSVVGARAAQGDAEAQADLMALERALDAAEAELKETMRHQIGLYLGGGKARLKGDE
jgi:hypothetical protein